MFSQLKNIFMFNSVICKFAKGKQLF